MKRSKIAEDLVTIQNNLVSMLDTEIIWSNDIKGFEASNNSFLCTFQMDMYGNMENILIDQRNKRILEYESILNEEGEVNKYFEGIEQTELENINCAMSLLWA